MEHHLIQLFFLIFSGAAVVASLALFGRQPLLVAYILLGAVMGPHGLAWVTDVDLIAEIASIGIIFLLFLLGLDMQPQALVRVLRQVTHITLISSLLFAAAGYGIGYLFGFSAVRKPDYRRVHDVFQHHYWHQALTHHGITPQDILAS